MTAQLELKRNGEMIRVRMQITWPFPPQLEWLLVLALDLQMALKVDYGDTR